MSETRWLWFLLGVALGCLAAFGGTLLSVGVGLLP